MIPGLTDRITAIGASAAALVFAAGMAWQTLQLHGVRGDLKEARAKVERVQAKAKVDLAKSEANYDRCKTNRTTLDDALKAQNEAFARDRKEAQRRIAVSEKNAAAARAVAESHARRFDMIVSERVGADVCAEADRIALKVAG